ncbi:hypothetical protein D9M71_769320 [compost metagenome]
MADSSSRALEHPDDSMPPIAQHDFLSSIVEIRHELSSLWSLQYVVTIDALAVLERFIAMILTPISLAFLCALVTCCSIV